MAVRMMKNLLMLVAISPCIPALSYAAESESVAKISDAGGTVMVDRGKGFVSTQVDAPLFENDRVITLDGSMAEITYSDGCRTKLKSNNLIVINIDPGCKAAILDATKAVAANTVASVHPLSYVPPVAGSVIIIYAISAATNGFGQ